MRRERQISRSLALSWGVLLVTACGAALGHPPERGERGERNEYIASPDQDRQNMRPQLPEGRALGSVSSTDCRLLLRAHGVVFEDVTADEAPGVEAPIRLGGPLGGVEIVSCGPSSNNEIIECRLALALLAWSADLGSADIVRIEHMSTYRPGARVNRTGEPSGHARAMAIDIARFHRRDSSILDMEVIWTNPVRGADPCGHVDGESDDLRTLRDLICTAIDSDLFQIVLTPHFDRVHRNHVHLEIRPDVDWTYVR